MWEKGLGGGDVTLAISSAEANLSGIARAAVRTRGNLVAGLELRAFTPPAGFVVGAAAVLVASGSAVLYADEDRGGSDVPLAGELGLGGGETVISRIRWDGSRLRLNDNDNLEALTLDDYFLAPGRRDHVQTLAGGVASFPAADHTSARAAGGGFVNFSNLPADVVAVLDGISVGDRFIFAVAHEAPAQLSSRVSRAHRSGRAAGLRSRCNCNCPASSARPPGRAARSRLRRASRALLARTFGFAAASVSRGASLQVSHVRASGRTQRLQAGPGWPARRTQLSGSGQARGCGWIPAWSTLRGATCWMSSPGVATVAPTLSRWCWP